ncbi:MAG: 30S ribosomal protein S3 [Chloroflexota bacterium]|nr:30S ribosomal protein S3 [Chloroflexota bacterium]MDE2929797.1 30S ribosomal protein S3 [Chloroflexota bacterium]
MGRKVHPVGFRLGFNRTWSSRWYAGKEYATLVEEDSRIRKMVLAQFEQPRGGATGGRRSSMGAGISQVDIERAGTTIKVDIHTARPGIVIGRGGAAQAQLRKDLRELTGKNVRTNIIEIRQPETNAYLVAQAVAEQLERRVSPRRAIKMAADRVVRSGAIGVKLMVGGRLGGAEMSRSEKEIRGTVPLQTLRANIDYGFTQAVTTYGILGVKAWIYTGDLTPEEFYARQEAATPEETPAPPPRRRRRRPRRVSERSSERSGGQDARRQSAADGDGGSASAARE